MKKLMLLLSFICLCLLMVGTALKIDNILFWLASPSEPYQYVRLVLAFIVLALFATNPPRHVLLRLSTGLVAAAAGAWTIHSTLVYAMNISDTICFFATSIAIGVALLERETSTYRAYKKSFMHKNSFPNFHAVGGSIYKPSARSFK